MAENTDEGQLNSPANKGTEKTEMPLHAHSFKGKNNWKPFITNSICKFVIIIFLINHPFKAYSQQQEFFVSTGGSDKNPGTRSKPFATIYYARNVVRSLKKKGSIDIILREGCYFLPETLVLDPEDSGTEESPITWRAAENEKVILSGGKKIDGKWKKVDERIWAVDIPEAKNNNWNFRQLFVNDKRMTRARFPNKSASLPFLFATGGGMSYIIIDKTQLKASWGKASDAQINMVPKWKFFNQWNTVKDVDMASGKINLENSELHAEIGKGDWFWIEGVKEELDEPGEWFLDNKNGKLYYMPDKNSDPNKQTVIAPYLNRLVYVKGDVEKKLYVKNINFKNIQFLHTSFSLGQIEPRVHTDAAILFENANQCRIENCLFENIGGYALWLHLDSKENVFDNNTVLESGGGGVLMTGARFSYMDESKLYTPGAVAATVFPILNRITNNTVKHCGKIRYYGGGVHLDSRPASMAMAPGNYITHNLFQDLSRNGIFAFRNQGGNVVEYNIIHDAMQTTIDGACIHFATMNHLNAPNYILNNYLYDIWGYEQKPDGIPVRRLGNGIFLDWATSNTTVKNNFIYNAAGESIKNIMGNINLSMTDNVVSETRIEPPFLQDLGPGKTATNHIDIEKNYLTGSVIHYTDSAFVKYSGIWKPVEISGGYRNLFSFNILEADSVQLSEITYTLPVTEDGTYQVSILYPPDAKNASNVKIQIHHADGISDVTWDMSKGDRYGFSLEIGKYRFKKGGVAKVVISNKAAKGRVVANSVAFVKVE